MKSKYKTKYVGEMVAPKPLTAPKVFVKGLVKRQSPLGTLSIEIVTPEPNTPAYKIGEIIHQQPYEVDIILSPKSSRK